MRKLIFIILALFLINNVSGISNVGKFHNDLANTGQSVYSSTNNGSIKWIFNSGGSGFYSEPVLDSTGIIYIGNSNYFYAIYSTNGTIKWKISMSVNGNSAIVDDNNIIYIANNNYTSNIYKYDAYYSNGTLKWSYTTPTPDGYIETKPTIDNNGIIYINSIDYTLNNLDVIALYSNNGTQKWDITSSTNTSEYSGVAIDKNGILYFGDYDFRVTYTSNLNAYYPNSSLKWKYNIIGTIDDTPAIDNTLEVIYIGANNGNLYAINFDGSLKWTYPAVFDDSDISIDSNHNVYFGSDNWNLYSIYPNGTLRWTYTALDDVDGAPTFDYNGNIYFGSYINDNKIYKLYPNGTLAWSVSVGSSITTPLIGSNGIIYISSLNGNLYAINSETPVTSYSSSGYTNTSTNVPIPGAQITFQNSTYSLSLISNINGYYSTNLLSNGTYSVSVSKTNFTTISPISYSITSTGDSLNFILYPQYVAKLPSITFDASSYITDDIISITAYATSPGTIVLIDSKGITKYSTTILSQETKTISYTVQSTDNPGIWRANLKNIANTVVVFDEAEINLPTVIPTPTITQTGRNWTLPDIFIWLRIYMPDIAFYIGLLYVVSLLGRLYKMYIE